MIDPVSTVSSVWSDIAMSLLDPSLLTCPAQPPSIGLAAKVTAEHSRIRDATRAIEFIMSALVYHGFRLRRQIVCRGRVNFFCGRPDAGAQHPQSETWR